MNITAIALPPHLHEPVCAAYPEYNWTFVASYARRGIFGLSLGKPLTRRSDTYALWSGDKGLASLVAELRGADVFVLHLGLLTPATSPQTACSMGVRSFMLLPHGAPAPRGEDGESLLLPRELSNGLAPLNGNVVAAQNDSRAADDDATAGSGAAFRHGMIDFLPKDCPPRRILKDLPEGYVLELTGRANDARIEQLIALHRNRVSLLPANIGLAQGLSVANGVITQDAFTAALALLMGKYVRVPDAAFAAYGPIRAALEAGGASIEALFVHHTRCLDGGTGLPLSFKDVRARVNAMLFPDGDAPSAVSEHRKPAPSPPLAGIEPDATLRLVVGGPKDVASPLSALFGGGNVIHAPATFNAGVLANNPDVFVGQDLIVWRDMPSPNWVRDSTGRIDLLAPYPVGIPLHLSKDGGFLPVLKCERLRGETDAKSGNFTVHYDLATDLEALDDATRRRLRALGHEMLPDLARLQLSWRPHRHNLFVMTRRLGLKDAPRFVVLGREAAHKGMPVHTNPDGVDDPRVIARLLEEHPDAEIIYQPHSSMSSDEVLRSKITGLSKRVSLIEAEYDPSELALAVDAFYTVDSPLGVAALMTGKPVTVYGAPSYAGLGLTHDVNGQGQARPLLVENVVDLPLFVGWYFTENVIFIDPMKGVRVSAENYAANWFPDYGEITDAIATRMVERALTTDNPEFRNAVLKMLQTQVKYDHVRALLDGLDMDHQIGTRPGSSLGYAEAYAFLGDWRLGLRIAAQVSNHHRSKVVGMVAETIPRIRSRLRTTDDRALFGHYLLTLFRKTPANDIEKIAHRLMQKRYFGAALMLFRSIRPTNALLAAICRCQIGRSDIGAAQQTITNLVARGMPDAQVQDLSVELDEAIGNWERVADALAERVNAGSGDLDVILRYATACANIGRYDVAHDQYISLMRTVKSSSAIRGLVSVEIARMNIPLARSLLEAYLASAGPDRLLYSLMGDCLSFENDLEGACDYYFRAVQLDALDTPSYTRMFALEEELTKEGRAPEVLWSTRIKAKMAQVRDDTVETLLGEGRMMLLENDIDTIYQNTARATELYPNDMRAYAWLGHAMAWTPGCRSASELEKIISCYRASISAGAEDGWWTSYDCVRSMAFLGQTDEIRRVLREQYQILFVAHKARMGWPRFMAGAALSDLGVTFGGLRDFPRTAMIRKHARNFRVADSIDEVRPGEKVMFLSEGGVGDEIRYAIPYAELADRFPDAVFSVDERLAPLYRRSFPNVAQFIPLPRFHRTRINRDLLPQIDKLPDQALAQFFDNNLWDAAQKVDVVIPAPSVMADLRPDVASFETAPRPRLIPDQGLVEAWRERLQPYAGNLLVGVIGTSRILEYQRVANYFTPDQMGDMYRLPGVTFVSLEYDYDEDLADHIRSEFGADYISFEDLDRMDDFDGVLALSHALDCVVGVNTATIELTAFGAVDTIFAAPNANHIWRDPHGTGKELFFDTMEIVLSQNPSEKHLVTARIAAMLEARRDAKLSKKKAV